MHAQTLDRAFGSSGALTAKRVGTRRTRGTAAPLWQPMPVGLTWSCWLRSMYLELALRVRVACKGFTRGLVSGGGVVGVCRLHATVYRANGTIERLGLIATRLITDAGVAFLVDDWDNNGQDLTTMNFHGASGDSIQFTHTTTVSARRVMLAAGVEGSLGACVRDERRPSWFEGTV